MINTVIQGDCLEVMKQIPDKSIDMILCDLPYGTTACKWDTIIPFEPLWEQYKRIIKDNGAIVLTASQPFTSVLVMSNPDMFRHSWVWNKKKGGNFAQSNFQPLKIHEDILVFSRGKNKYFPQKIDAQIPSKRHLGKLGENTELRKKAGLNMKVKYSDTYEADKLMPISILEISKDNYKLNSLHPTQKPVKLFEYLIKTYTNEGDLVLDNCAGSFTTAIAAENTKRNWICMEQLEEYCEIGKKRINENRARLRILDNCDIIK
jgi:site-specific DNA-methyltransferase (adenine-specific)